MINLNFFSFPVSAILKKLLLNVGRYFCIAVGAFGHRAIQVVACVAPLQLSQSPLEYLCMVFCM